MLPGEAAAEEESGAARVPPDQPAFGVGGKQANTEWEHYIYRYHQVSTVESMS